MSSHADAQRRLLDLATDLEAAKTAAARKKLVSRAVELVRDDGGQFRSALDFASRAAAYDPSLVDWSALLSLVLGAATGGADGGGKKARTAGPTAELWQQLHFLFEQSERSGRHLTRQLVDACVEEAMALLHSDHRAGAGSSAASSSSSSSGASDRDPLRIQGAIASLAAILECVLGYAPYAHQIKQEHLHDLFALFSDTLLTLSHLTPHELSLPAASLLPLIRPHSRFPDSFLGLYHAPAAAVNLLSLLLQHYPYSAAGAAGAAHTRTFLTAHVCPLFLSLFALRLPDNLVTRLLAALNHCMERHVAVGQLALFRTFTYKFLYNMMQPGAWPKSTTVKHELVRFCNLVLRVSNQLPHSPLRIVEELDSAHPLYRLLYRELDSDILFTSSGLPDQDGSLQLDSATHSFLCLCSHVFAHVLLKPEPSRSADQASNDAADAAAGSAAGSSGGAAAAAVDSSSSARKRRRLESDAAFSAERLWDQYSASTGLPSVRLVSWLKFLYVFAHQYPAFFQLHAPQASHQPAALLAQLLQGLLRASERTRPDVKLWSLACLSRLASACHLNGVQLHRPPSTALLQSFPSAMRADVARGYSEVSALFAQAGDLLVRKHLLDERRLISRSALSLLTKLASYNLLGGAQLAHLQTVLAELPALRQATAPLMGAGLSSQLMIKKEMLLSPQPKAGGGASFAMQRGTGVKMESGGHVGAVAPLQSLLSSECDLVTLRFLIAFLQRFDLASGAVPDAATVPSSAFPRTSPFSASASSPAFPQAALRIRSSAGSSSSSGDSLSEEDVLRWILSFRFGSSLFNPTMHPLRSLWSTSQWFAAAVTALNRLQACAGQVGVCLEDEFAEDVRLPAPQSRFVYAARPHSTWLKTDMGGDAVDVHSPASLRDYCVQAQFAPLVSRETTRDEVELHRLPSLCCQQHQSRQQSPLPIGDSADLSPVFSASAARSSSLRQLTLTVLTEHIDALQRAVEDRSQRTSVDMDTTDHRNSNARSFMKVDDSDDGFGRNVSAAASAASADGGASALRVEDAAFAVRFYAHYVHILCALMQSENAAAKGDAQQQASVQENRPRLLGLLSTCLVQLSALLPQLTSNLDSSASSHLLAYLSQLLSHFERELTATHLASGEMRVERGLQQGCAALQAAVLRVLMRGLNDAKERNNSNGSRRSLAFDDMGSSSYSSSSAARSSLYTSADLYSETGSASSTPPFDSLLSLLTLLLRWRLLAPVNQLDDLKRFLDNHMGLKSNVRDCPLFYRLAHAHALAKSVARTPHPNQDLMYYLSYLAEECASRPPEGSTIVALSRDALQYRAMGFFLDLAASIRGGWITLDGEAGGGEEDRMHTVWSKIFADMIGKGSGGHLHRFVRVLKARGAYAGLMSGLTNDWSLVRHLINDLVAHDLVVRLFAATQVRLVLTTPNATAIFPSFEKCILKAMGEPTPADVKPAAAAASAGASSDGGDRRESMIMTLLACLAQMGLSMESKERTILLHMCYLWRDRPSARPLIALVYAQLSSCLHYQQRALSSSSALQTALLRKHSSSLFPPSTSASLLDDHFDFVLAEWLHQKMSIADFPRELLVQQGNGAGAANSAGVEALLVAGGGGHAATAYSLDSFLRQYAGRIAAIVVIHHDTMDSTLQLLLQSLGCDSATLLKRHFAICCARFYSLYAQTTDDKEELVSKYIQAATGVLEFLKKALTERKFSSYYHSRLNDTICALVDLVVMEPSGPRLASYALSNFLTSLTQLAKAEKLDVPHHLCSPVQDRIQSLLLYLRVRIASEFRAFRQWKLFEIVRAVVLDCTGEFLSAPAVWRPIADLLLWMLPEFDARFPTHAHECARLLSDVTLKLISQVALAPAPETRRAARGSKAAAADGASAEDGGVATAASGSVPQISIVATMPASEMMLHVRHVITAMIEYSGAAVQLSSGAHADEMKNDTDATRKIDLVAGLVLGLIRALPPAQHGELTLLPPFPAHPSFAELGAVYASLSQERTLAEEIICFLLNVRSSATPKEGSAGLAHLLEQLRARQPELNQLLQPIPPSLSSLGLEVLALPASDTAPGRRSSSGGAGGSASKSLQVRNSIITVDGHNPSLSDALDACSDLNASTRVSHRILSSPDYESSGHWGFDIVAPLIGALCAFCNWSHSEANGGNTNAAARSAPAGDNRLNDAARIRMLAVQCLGEIGAVDPDALNGHNSRVFRCGGNPLPPIGRPMPSADVAHPFAGALLAAPSSASSSAAAAAQLHASWYGRWYAVGGGLQASACDHRELRREPQSYFNHPHHVLTLYLLNHYARSSNAHVGQLASHALTNLFAPEQKGAAAAEQKGAEESHNGATSSLHPPSSQLQMIAAFAQLDMMTQSYLSPFWATKLKTFRSLLRARSREEPEAEVWDASAGGGRGFDEWICKLVRHLLSKRVRDPVLIHCAGLAQHLPDLAARLFPFAIFDVLAQGDESAQQTLAMRFNALVASMLTAPVNCMASPPSSLPVAPAASASSDSSSALSSNSRAVLQVLLSALQYVREQVLMIHRQPLASSSSSKSQAGAQARDRIDLARGLESNWDAKLDLIKLAQAAQSCDMYATSLLLLEQWHVRTYGRMNVTSAQDEAEFKESLLANKQQQQAQALSSSSQSPNGAASSTAAAGASASVDERAQYQSLLLEVCRAVTLSDPDLVYGALHSRDVLDDDVNSDLIVSEHEGNYAKTLQIYDSIFQHARRGARELGSMRTPGALLGSGSSALMHSAQSPSHTATHAGLVRSLQRLGCTHLVDHYMHDLSASDVAAYSSIQDAHYEAAWRTSNWDLQTHSLAGGGGGGGDASTAPGLQTCLFHGLRSLHELTVQHKNAVAFQSSLSGARSRLVQELASAGPETTHRVFPAIVHLHLLADLERSWSILDSPADAMDTGAAASSSASSTPVGARFTDFESVGRKRLLLLTSDFDQIEPILALRGVILQLAQQPAVLATHLRFVASLARQSDRRVVGAHAIREGASNALIPRVNRLALKLEEAQLSWSEGAADSAIRSAKHVVTALNALVPSASAAAAGGGGGSDGGEDAVRLLIDASCLVAEWMSRSHSEASHVIQKFLSSASTLAASVAGPVAGAAGAGSSSSSAQSLRFQAAQQHKVYYQLACFSDRTFQALHSKSQSVEHLTSRQLYHSNAAKIRQLNESMADPAVQTVMRNRDTSDEKIVAARQVYNSKQLYIRRLEKEHAVDTAQVTQFDRSLAQALEQAFVGYTHCLRLGDTYDTQVVYRLIALWFNHYAAAPFTAEKLHNVNQLNQIPSRKFLPLVYQIAAQMAADVPGISPEQKHFRASIRELIKRMVLDHPYHSLCQLFALAHGDQVSRVSMPVAGGVEMNEHRIRAAQELLAELKRAPSVRDIVAAEEKIILAYIALGSHKFSRGIDHINFSSTPLAALRQRDLALVAVPTLTLPVRADCNYRTAAASADGGAGAGGSVLESPVVTIASFDRHIYMATSGVNVPLILEMVCSDGKRHKQLLKSADDARQDACLEQLFKLVNVLLQVNRETAKRQMHMRTYNVVPLTPGVGLVEWVTNTTSLAECLVTDRTGAHVRHARPGQQRDYRRCLGYLREAHEARNPEEYARRFHAVCADFPPVFHRFFLEAFPAPAEWLARRTAYTRSVAVSSIVGFAVGLGDRHIHNILFDSHSAEIIHIDLGVAFDMGAVLKTPEIVPFRLTRDMVDAMGVTGVEGAFRQGAESSMRVLRANREMLLTVLEVFYKDPLYKWALSPAKIQQLRPLSQDEEAATLSGAAGGGVTGAPTDPDASSGDDSVDSINSGAARAMFNVKQRLAGAAHKDTLSVEGQVNALIHEATDMERLAKMYYGWSAFV